MEHMSEESSMHPETRFVQSVCHYRQNILDKCKEILSVETLRYIWSTSNILKQFIQNVQAHIAYISLSVLRCPYNNIHSKLLLLCWNVEEAGKTVLNNGLDKIVKLYSVLRKVFIVDCDHFKCTRKNMFEEFWYQIAHMRFQSRNNLKHEHKNLHITSIGNAFAVIGQYGVEYWWENIGHDGGRISFWWTALFNVRAEQANNFLFSRSD
mmetsp:Transcript_11016/g.16648  ORF Transcript_11016/g.16648 Transcript_11016/m.16648 type:complete len:209 (+) Transcript_11016:452-1078(+)